MYLLKKLSMMWCCFLEFWNRTFFSANDTACDGHFFNGGKYSMLILMLSIGKLPPKKNLFISVDHTAHTQRSAK